MQPDSRTAETVRYYRHAYGKDEISRWAFARLLESGGIFKRIDTEEQKAAHNATVTLLENMGMTQGVNYDRLAGLMFSLTIPDEAIDPEG